MSLLLTCMGLSTVIGTAWSILSVACCCSSVICATCTRVTGFRSSLATRISYAVLFFAASTVAWSSESTGWLDNLFSSLPLYGERCARYPPLGPNGASPSAAEWALLDPQSSASELWDCVPGGRLALLRVLAALFAFHLLQSILLLGVKSSRDPRAGIQNGFWLMKLLILGSMIIGAFFIPISVFSFYAYSAFVGSLGFIFIQLVILIDFAYNVSEFFVEKYEKYQFMDREIAKTWAITMWVTVVSLAIVLITSTVLLYVFFTTGTGCSLNIFFITFNLILSLAVMVVSLLPVVQEHNPLSGIFQPLIVALYNTYLCADTLLGQTNSATSSCNPFKAPYIPDAGILGTILSAASSAISSSSASSSLDAPWHSNDTLMVVVNVLGTLITVLTLSYSATRYGSHNYSLAESSTNNYSLALMSDNGDSSDDADAEHTGDEAESCQYSYSTFHFIFALAALYMSMLLSDWGAINLSGAPIFIGHEWLGIWIRIVTSWIGYGLFSWTLVAPIFLPDRFSFT